MFLPEVEKAFPKGFGKPKPPYPQILHLLAYKPVVTNHFQKLSHAVMRGPSPLSPGLRELIAAFTSKENRCPF